MGSWAFNPSGFFDYWSPELFRIYGLDPAKGAPTLNEYLASVHPIDREFMAGTIEKMLLEGSGCDVKQRIVMVKQTMELVLQRVHPEDAALVKQTIERASQDGKDFNFEHRLLMPDGSVKYVRVVAHAERDESGELEFVGAVMDVTATKQVEEALRASEQQWRDVFENNPTMYFMVDAEGIVMAVNPFGAEQLGYNVDELVGQPVLRVFYEPDREAVQRNVASCFEHLGLAKSWEAHKVCKDGKVLWVRETAKAVPRVNGPIVLIACEDITEQKRTEEALRHAQADLAHVNRVTTMGELTASLAHEVNQPN